jgi:hypothetical protein
LEKLAFSRKSKVVFLKCGKYHKPGKGSDIRKSIKGHWMKHLGKNRENFRSRKNA